MKDFDRKKLMYFQFSSHLLLFAWRLPPPTGKKDFFRCGYDDDDDDDDDDDGDDDDDDDDKNDDVEEEENIVRCLSPQTREKKFEQNMGKEKYFK